MFRIRNQMCLIFMAALLITMLSGCGGKHSSQQEMMKNAIRRDKDNVDEKGTSKTLGVDKTDAPQLADRKPPPPVPPVAAAKPNRADDKLVSPTASTPAEPPQPIETPSSVPLPPVAIKPDHPLTSNEKAQRTVKNLETIGAAIIHFSERTGCLPASAIYDQSGTPLLSWRVALLPELGYQDLYNRFRLDQPWYTPHNKALLAEVPAVYQSPERFDDKTTYLVPHGTSTAFQPPNRHIVRRNGEGFALRNIEDGVANTAILLEVDAENAVPWTQPVDFTVEFNDSTKGLGATRPNGFFVVWGNGLVGWIESRIHKNQMIAMFTVDGGESFNYTEVNQSVDTVLNASSEPKPAIPPLGITSMTPGEMRPSYTPPRESPLIEKLNKQIDQAILGERDRDATALMSVLILVEKEGTELRNRVKWYPGLRRPAFAIRWGIAVNYVGPQDLKNTSPIGQKNRVGSERSSRVNRQLKSDAGELIVRMISLIDEHNARGGSGSLFVLGDESPSSNRTKPRESSTLPVATVAPEYYSPGIMTWGRAPRRGSLHLCGDEGLDILVEFSVTSKKLRDNAIHTTTTISIVDAMTGTTLYESKPLNNLQVERARGDATLDDPVPSVFAELARFLQSELMPVEIPSQLKPVHVRGRIAKLVADAGDEPLSALVEARLYHDLGLISDVEFFGACESLLGVDAGKRLSHGSPEEILTLLSKWVPRVE